MDTTTPSDVVRHAMKYKLIDAEIAEAIIVMVKIRNKTSHIYKEEIADFTAKKAYEHYTLMYETLDKMKP